MVPSPSPDVRSEVWAILGAGRGEVGNERTPGAVPERSDLTLWMGSAGARRALASVGALDLALLGDAGFARVETEDDAGVQQVVEGLTVEVWRVRAGVEGSYTSVLGSGATVTPFVEMAGRYDGGDGGGGAGVEVSPGVFISDPGSGFGLEARGRMLVLHSGEGYEEYGASVTASLSPGAGGEGLSLSVSPRWGAGGGSGADTLWREEHLGRQGTGPVHGEALSLEARMGYGMRYARGLLTPFGELGLREEDRRRMRVGMRFAGRNTGAGALHLEVSGERSESAGRDAEHRVGLTARLRF